MDQEPKKRKDTGRKPNGEPNSRSSNPAGAQAPIRMVRHLEQQSYKIQFLNDSLRLWLKAATEMGFNVRHITPPPLWAPFRENPFDPSEQYYTRKEAAAFLDVSLRTLASYIKSGKIREIRYSARRCYIAATDLVEFARKGI